MDGLNDIEDAAYLDGEYWDQVMEFISLECCAVFHQYLKDEAKKAEGGMGEKSTESYGGLRSHEGRWHSCDWGMYGLLSTLSVAAR